jgi:hypothetical protein
MKPMLNMAITPTAEALLQQLMQAGEGEPAVIIEPALQFFAIAALLTSKSILPRDSRR